MDPPKNVSHASSRFRKLEIRRNPVSKLKTDVRWRKKVRAIFVQKAKIQLYELRLGGSQELGDDPT